MTTEIAESRPMRGEGPDSSQIEALRLELSSMAIKLEQLAAALPTAPAERLVEPPVFDLPMLRRMTGGDDALVQEMVQLFATDAADMVREIRAAVAVHSPRRLRDAAHRLKGGAGSFAASRVEAAARALETVSFTPDLAGAPALCDQLDAEMGALMNTLSRLGVITASGGATTPTSRNR